MPGYNGATVRTLEAQRALDRSKTTLSNREIAAPVVEDIKFETESPPRCEGFSIGTSSGKPGAGRSRTLLDSGLPGAGGGCGGGRPAHRILVLGLARRSGFGRFRSRSRHGGPERRGSRRLVFLVLPAHVAALVEDSSWCRPGNPLGTAALYIPLVPRCHPASSIRASRAWEIAASQLVRFIKVQPPRRPFRCLLGAALLRGPPLATELPTH